jgi:hypothetical protein
MNSRAMCVAVVAIIASLPSRGESPAKMDSDIQVADRFGRAPASGDFVAAHKLLTGQALEEYSPEALKKAAAGMISYAPGPIQHVEVMRSLRVWPARKPGDIAWVYVALTGESFPEAVTVVLCATRHGSRIRSIEWGRPQPIKPRRPAPAPL